MSFGNLSRFTAKGQRNLKLHVQQKAQCSVWAWKSVRYNPNPSLSSLHSSIYKCSDFPFLLKILQTVLVWGAWGMGGEWAGREEAANRIRKKQQKNKCKPRHTLLEEKYQTPQITIKSTYFWHPNMRRLQNCWLKEKKVRWLLWNGFVYTCRGYKQGWEKLILYSSLQNTNVKICNTILHS